GREDHEVVLGVLISFDDVVSLDRLAFLRTDVLLLERCPTLLVDHAERDRLRTLTGRVERNRNRDETERDDRGTNRMCAHRTTTLARASLWPAPPKPTS